MPKEKGKSSCSDCQSEVRTPVGRPTEISPGAYQLLRNATIPIEFKEAVREVMPNITMPFSTDLESPATSSEIDMSSIKVPTPRMSVPPVEMPVPSLPVPQVDVPALFGDRMFYVTDLTLDLSAVAHMTPGLQNLARFPLATIVLNLPAFWGRSQMFFLAQDGSPPNGDDDEESDGGSPVTEVIKVEDPEVTPLEDDKGPVASVNVVWPVEAPCPCENVKATQEIKGFVKHISRQGKELVFTARDIVRITLRGGSFREPDIDSLVGQNKPDKSETEFIPDLNAHDGTWTYPDSQVDCKNLDGGKSMLKLKDAPGSSARVGPRWETIQMRLTFRTSIYCNDKFVDQFIWHIKYDLTLGPVWLPPEVGLGEIK